MNHYGIIANFIIILVLCYTSRNNTRIYNTSIASDILLAILVCSLFINIIFQNNIMYIRLILVIIFVVFCIWLRNYSISREICESIYKSIQRNLDIKSNKDKCINENMKIDPKI